MKTKGKALLLSLCAILLIAASVLGTIAYLTSFDVAINTFTVGSVSISLDETDTDEDGNEEDNVTVEDVVRDKANGYHLLPGHTYVKDPKIHVANDSEDCYLFVKVENGIKDIETTETEKTIATQMGEYGWKAVSGTENVYIFTEDKGDKCVVSGSEDVEIFDTFTIDGIKVVNVPEGEEKLEGEIDIKEYANAEIVVTAYAVQKDGFENESPENIWKTVFGN